MSQEVKGNVANRFFNRSADAIDKFVGNVAELTMPTRKRSTDALDQEVIQFGYLFLVLPIGKSLQGLASLSASITGDRRRAPQQTGRRI